MVLCSTASAARVRTAYEERARVAQRPVTAAQSESITPHVLMYYIMEGYSLYFIFLT